MADRETQPAVRVVLLSRTGCHLCDEARSVIAEVCAQLSVGWREEDIAAPGCPPEVRRRHADDIPVTFVDGAVHDFWRVDPQRLREALTRQQAPGGGPVGP